MREFKFRIWDTSTNSMHYTVQVGCDDITVPTIWSNRRKEWLHVERSNAKIMQYTGMKDSNGNEIYEGDIVTYKVKGSKQIYKTIMEFNKEHGAFLFGIYEGVIMPCGKKTRTNKYTRKSVNSVEVIGNIFEGEGIKNE
ncbi:YopX family protein [Clostridium sp.]|uniref:YopX family protein n=1 Tax=Clostridium sp. TaxID=1506 RepID=UPI003992049D